MTSNKNISEEQKKNGKKIQSTGKVPTCFIIILKTSDFFHLRNIREWVGQLISEIPIQFYYW